jgi:hypothetical protein
VWERILSSSLIRSEWSRVGAGGFHRLPPCESVYDRHSRSNGGDGNGWNAPGKRCVCPRKSWSSTPVTDWIRARVPDPVGRRGVSGQLGADLPDQLGVGGGPDHALELGAVVAHLVDRPALSRGRPGEELVLAAYDANATSEITATPVDRPR